MGAWKIAAFRTDLCGYQRILGVLGGMLPYFAAAQMIVNLLEGNRDMSLYFKWLCIGMVGYLVRTLLYTLALSISHKATFSVLKTIRQKILAKLPKLPLGTVTDMSSGKMKQLIVDQVDGMENNTGAFVSGADGKYSRADTDYCLPVYP